MTAEQATVAKPEGALPVLRDVLEIHRLEVDNGALAEDLANWVKEEQPDFDWKKFGFQEFGEMLNFAQDKGVVRVEPDEEKGLLVYLGSEFHPPAVPEAEPEAISDEQPTEEPQPLIMGIPASRLAKATRRPRRKAAAATAGASPRRTSRGGRRTTGTGTSRRARPAPASDAQPTE
jgi:hypothetical protein